MAGKCNRNGHFHRIAETMIQAGCRWRPSDRTPRSRISGKLEIHKRLKVEDREPGIRIFSNCRNGVLVLIFSVQ